MAAPSKKIYSVGMNAMRYYLLNSSGYMAATNATVYAGVPIGGPVSWVGDDPSAEVVSHPGNNGIRQTDVLPSNTVNNMTLTVSREDADAIAAFTNTLVQVIGSFANMVGYMTSQQGNNPTVALVGYDQAKDPSGNRVWRTHVAARALVNPKRKGMSRERADMVYDITPQICGAHLTSLPFTANDNGFLTAQIVTYTSTHRLAFSAWKTTATETEYNLDTSLPAATTGGVGMVVYKNGALMTYGATADATHYTASTTKITFGAALTNGDMVTTMYEIADTAIDID